MKVKLAVKNIPVKYYGISQWPAKNGLNYDKDIDSAIFSELFSSNLASSGELKRKIERVLNRKITLRTYYNHLKMLVSDNMLEKRDTGERGKRSVFYSLSADAKRRKRLHLLRTDPEYSTTKHICMYNCFSDTLHLIQ